MSLFAAAGPSAYWYLTRGTGVVALVLLTVSVVFGILGSIRFAAHRWPRFAIDTVHRDVSLLVIVVLVVHIITSILDSFAPIRVTDAVIPFVSRYRPLWLGLGALSFDLLVAVSVTSLVRRRLGYRSWRAVHWLAYASWPVAVLHGLGTGSDAKVGWVLATTVACVVAVTAATLVRIARSAPADGGRRGAAAAVALAVPVGIAVFTLQGPLRSGWARRAGTPSTLLARAVTPAVAVVRPRVADPKPKPAGATLEAPFDANLSGTVTQTQQPDGAIVDLALQLSGGARGKLRVRLGGTPLGGGGLSMTGSQVDLLASGLPDVMAGKIVALQGTDLVARVSDGSGRALDLRANLEIDSNSGSVSGTLSATDAGGARR
ncbi:MAG: ferric reductase-like transmembrane domain-containing protein [Solirubrobacteraceae bacterium]